MNKKYGARSTQQAAAVARILLLLLWIAPLLSPVLMLSAQAQAETCTEAILHYRRRGADYEGWGLHVWGPTPDETRWDAPLQPAGQDDYGIYWVVAMGPGATFLNYIIHKGDEKDPGPDQQLLFAAQGCEIWLLQGRDTQYGDATTAMAALEVRLATAPAITETQVLLHYRRVLEDYDGWGLHVWGPTTEEGVTWASPLMPAGQDEYGIYWIINMEEGAEVLNYIVHKGDEKDPGPDQSLDLAGTGREVWLIQGSGEQFTDPEAALQGLLAAGIGDIKNKAQAHWLTRDTLAWPVEFGSRAIFRLHHDPLGGITVTQQGLEGGRVITLEFAGDDLSPELAERFPHLRTAVMLKIPSTNLPEVPEILKGQFALSVSRADGAILAATAIQIPGVLDDLYANDEALGVIFERGRPALRVWAPTARSVTLHLFPDSHPQTISHTYPMTWDASTGIWSINGEASWYGQYYRYEVEVYVRQEGRVVHNLVTDPYAISLSMNSTRSQIIDLHDPSLLPHGWQSLVKPEIAAPEDIVLYELHIRDFSIFDPGVPESERGTYLAFTHPESAGMRHLKRLAEAGVTHIHLLPAFDIATINENKAEWVLPDYDLLASLPPDSEEQQAMIEATRGKDGYNWGYDPFHYSTPEGSYATEPDGPARIREFRQMVQTLNATGLRVVMDVVYNHTNAAGQSEKSVLDRVVPGYYHRLDSNGNVTTSTCCANTATEHAMMEKLMLDSLLLWAREYKIDGFRFDLMGHHMVSNMQRVRAALNSLSVGRDGVDGRSIYIYGEGWDFGEVANNARGRNASQLNLAGTGIGTFNDRVRDAARGGSPFRGLQEQGFITGLFTDPNEATDLPEKSQLATLLELSDNIRISLAGNLANYQLVNAEGLLVTGDQLNYNGAPAGYTQDPQENVVYVSAHDNETLFDAIQYKAPLSTSMADRVRMQNLGLSIVALSQGVPFFHAGDELLRSKSLDRDSYDSGDWFNRLDYTYQTNNWGVGLPPKDKNGGNYPIMRELLARPELKPSPEHIQMSLAHFEELLRIRKSSPLFRLNSAAQIHERVAFHNTGPAQLPGLIVMSLRDGKGQTDLDPHYDLIIVLFNGSPEALDFRLEALQNASLVLHPLQANSSDPLVRTATFERTSKTFTVPGRTTAVFVGNGGLAGAPDIKTAAPVSAGLSLLPWLVALAGVALSVVALAFQAKTIRRDMPAASSADQDHPG